MSERLRTFLGVWAPMAFGVLLIGTAVNFYLHADLGLGIRVPDVESWRLACSSGVVFVGGVMILSTYGRFRKMRAARAATPPKEAAP